MYKIFEEKLKEKGITPYRLAKDTRIPTSTLSDWKTGRSTPKLDKLIIIAEYLGISLEELIGKDK